MTEVAFWLFIINAPTLPLGARPSDLAPVTVGITPVPFKTEQSCRAAKKWVEVQLKRAAACLEQ